MAVAVEEMMQVQELKLKSIQYRRSIVDMIKTSGAGHTGGSLSCVDVLNVLYNHVMKIDPAHTHDPNRDRYIQSKGHSVEALYAVLAGRGFFPESDLKTLNQYNSPYIGHPTRSINGIEQNTGALGHGLSLAVGTALAAKMDGKSYRVFTLLGDGELAEGSSWEALMTAAHYKLDNLTIIIDRNRLQITGSTESVNALEPLEAKFSAFGAAVCQVDGNDVEALVNLFSMLPFVMGKPNLIIANTIKGKGISFMQDTVKWHHRVPTEDEYQRAMVELDAQEAELKAVADGTR